MVLDEIKIKPSKFKNIFREMGIPPASIAKYLGFSYPYTVHLLNGTHKMSEETKQKLSDLLSEIEKESA